MTQAVLEGVAFAFGYCQQVFLDTGTEINEVSLIGGGSKSKLWAQILASVLERPMIRYDSAKMVPALGASRLAMLAKNNASLEETCQQPRIKEIIEPNLKHVPKYRKNRELYQRHYRNLEKEFYE